MYIFQKPLASGCQSVPSVFRCSDMVPPGIKAIRSATGVIPAVGGHKLVEERSDNVLEIQAGDRMAPKAEHR